MHRKKLPVAAAAVVALGPTGAGIAIAGGAGDDDKPLTGSALDQVTAAALAHPGGGKVTETETGDDGAAYGVEVRLGDDGRKVEVSLDENFKVFGQESDDDGANEQDGADDD